MLKQAELLAPAGNKESFLAALNAGADAIYMGVDKYNARNMAQNFNIEEYIYCIWLAHTRGVKVYLTMNTLLYDNEIEDAMNTLLLLYSKGLDAVIVQDIGIANLIREVIPNLPLHASTQMSIYNLEGVKYLESLGFSRVVLARELSIEEIENIVKNTKIEIEVFVHGALCVCLSGGCQMSALIGDRSANRGNCAQPCRQAYSLYKNGKKITDNKYLLSKKDIYGIDYIDELISLGVHSLKIEGRNRSPEYVAGVIAEYRKKIDKEQINEKEIMQLFSRSGKSAGYLNGIVGKESISYNTPKNTGLLLGQVIEYTKPYVKLKLKENISLHDGIEIHAKDGIVSNIITNIKNLSKKNENIDSLVGDIVLLGDIKQKVENGSYIYKTSNNKLSLKLYKEYVENTFKRKNIVSLSFELTQKSLSVVCNINDKKINITSEYIPEKSIKSSVTYETIEKVFAKTENTPYILKTTEYKIEPSLFVPTSILNELRRNLIDKIGEEYRIELDITEKKSKLKKCIENKNEKLQKVKNINSLYLYNYNSSKEYISYYNEKYGKNLNRIYIDKDYLDTNINEIQKYTSKDIEVYSRLSNFTFENIKKIEEGLEKQIAHGVTGIVVSNISQLELAKKLRQKYNVNVIANYTLNIVNSKSVKFLLENEIYEMIAGVDIDEITMNDISKYINIDIIEGVISAMTSRYCIVNAWDNTETKCNYKCLNNEYYIIDGFNKKYNIITDSKNHIMKLIRNNSKKHTNINNVNVIKTEI